MAATIHQLPQRRAVRRALSAPCIAVAADRYKLFGQKVLDLSPRGMLVETRVPMDLGEKVMVTFATPGADPIWMHAQAEVTRRVGGRRPGDAGNAVGLRFTALAKDDRHELLTRLAGIPPTIPRRALRVKTRGVALAA